MKLPAQEVLNENYVKNFMSAQDIRTFFPRPISTPHGYLNSRYYNIHCHFKLHNSQDKYQPALIDTQRRMLINKLIIEEFPTYYVKEQFLTAVHQTNPPDFDITTLHLPREAFIIVLPFGMLQKDGLMISFIAFTRLDKDDFAMSAWGHDKTNFKFELFQVSNYKTFNELKSRIGINYETRDTGVNIELANDIAKEIEQLFFKLLLILNSRPKLISISEASKDNKQKPYHKSKHTTPLWIGESYTICDETTNKHHKSPIIHFRRGHIRNQAFGEGHKQHKIIWIEPTIVGANN